MNAITDGHGRRSGPRESHGDGGGPVGEAELIPIKHADDLTREPHNLAAADRRDRARRGARGRFGHLLALWLTLPSHACFCDTRQASDTTNDCKQHGDARHKHDGRLLFSEDESERR